MQLTAADTRSAPSLRDGGRLTSTLPTQEQRTDAGVTPAMMQPIATHRTPGEASTTTRRISAQADQAARDNMERLGRLGDVPVRADPAVVGKHAGQARYAAQAGPLFTQGASPHDVVQGGVGDCWLLGSAAAVAATNPDAIARAIRDNQDGTFTAQFFTKGRDGGVTTEEVRIDGDIPHAGGKPLYARSADVRERWPALLEKAWASKHGGYARLDGGFPNDALFALTGRTAATVFTRTENAQSIFETLTTGVAGRVPMVAASKSSVSLARDGIVPGHAYTVLGAQRIGGEDIVELRDPYAKYEPRSDGRADGTFRLSASRFHALFQYVVVGKSEGAVDAGR